MSYEPWPSPDAPRGPLPRIEDLPLAEQGYDQEAVREAFDSFYRHAAQLDASLRALEAVDAFRQDAYELRNELRSLRSLGFGAQETAAWTPSYAPAGPRFEIPSAVPRLAFEAAVIVAVAVIAGVAHFKAWVIVALMVAAWAIVGISEWLAARARFVVPAGASYPESALQPPVVGEDTAAGWSAVPVSPPAPELDPEEPEALTVVEPPAEADGEPASVQTEDVDAAEPARAAEREPEPEPAPGREAEAEGVDANGDRRRWFRRRRDEHGDADDLEAVAAPASPSHVRVLDAWEQQSGAGDASGIEPEAESTGGRLRRRRR